MATWTQFADLHSGGRAKESFELLFIEAPLEEAISVFYSRFKHDPRRITCTCCGSDYSIMELDTDEELADILDYEWEHDGQAEFIVAAEIQREERRVTVPKQGWYWQA